MVILMVILIVTLIVTFTIIMVIWKIRHRERLSHTITTF